MNGDKTVSLYDINNPSFLIHERFFKPSISRSLDTVPSEGRAGEFIQMPIDSKGLIDTSILPSLLFFPTPLSLSLSLSFVIHRIQLSYTTIFVSTTRARDNDRDIRFLNLFINAQDGAVQEYPGPQPVARKMRLPSDSPLRNRQVTHKRLRQGQGLLRHHTRSAASRMIYLRIIIQDLIKSVKNKKDGFFRLKKIIPSVPAFASGRKKKIIAGKRNCMSIERDFAEYPNQIFLFYVLWRSCVIVLFSLKLRRVAPNDRIKENEKCLPDSWCSKARYYLEETKLRRTKLQKKRVRGKEEDPGA